MPRSGASCVERWERCRARLPLSLGMAPADLQNNIARQRSPRALTARIESVPQLQTASAERRTRRCSATRPPTPEGRRRVTIQQLLQGAGWLNNTGTTRLRPAHPRNLTSSAGGCGIRRRR